MIAESPATIDLNSKETSHKIHHSSDGFILGILDQGFARCSFRFLALGLMTDLISPEINK
jgi:hypothetical protein